MLMTVLSQFILPFVPSTRRLIYFWMFISLKKYIAITCSPSHLADAIETSILVSAVRTQYSIKRISIIGSEGTVRPDGDHLEQLVVRCTDLINFSPLVY